MNRPPKEIQGLAARRAALKLLDAVLRRGETLDQAAGAATAGLLTSSDGALARAIAGEVLRWTADIDALIDSATRQRLADDAKARTVLRIMLAQWLRLETPPHAVVATGLPLLAGGPRRLAHGVFGALVRKGVALPEAPTLPAPVAARWGERARAIAAGLAEPPPLDLTLRARRRPMSGCNGWAAGACCPVMSASRVAPQSATSPDTATARGGCRTSPHRFPRACSAPAWAAAR